MKALKTCYNGCGKPVHYPSKVLCKDCLDAVGKKLQEIIDKMEARKCGKC